MMQKMQKSSPPEPGAPLGRPKEAAAAPGIDRLVQFLVEGHDRLRFALEELSLLASGLPPSRLQPALDMFRESLVEHFDKEEQLLFPLLRDGQARHAGGPIRSLEREHEDSWEALGHLLDITAAEAHVAPRQLRSALQGRLEALAIELRDHVRLESQVLFRIALGN